MLQHPSAFKEAIHHLAERAASHNPDVIVGIESRGFIFGVPIALELGLPFGLTRKLGKLPYDRITEEYALEYGTNTIEMHVDAIAPGERAYVVDDLLATGGTAAATARLIERLRGEICAFGFLVELEFLEGRKNLLGYQVDSLITY